jgi:hypothetical protein
MRRHPYLAALACLAVGLSFGTALAVLERSLPSPLGTLLLVGVLAAALAWAVRSLIWARGQLRELRRLERELDDS